MFMRAVKCGIYVENRSCYVNANANSNLTVLIVTLYSSFFRMLIFHILHSTYYPSATRYLIVEVLCSYICLVCHIFQLCCFVLADCNVCTR